MLTWAAEDISFYVYGARVVAEHKRTGDHPEALADIFGWIEFSGNRTVEKNKSDILDDLTSLEEVIEQRSAGLIARPVERHTARPFTEITDQLNQRLKKFPLQSGNHAKREAFTGPHIKAGTVEPTGEGGKHTQAAEDPAWNDVCGTAVPQHASRPPLARR